MLQIPDNVRLDLNKFVPSSTLCEVSCFSFYDNHPRDETKLDIIVCSSKGEIKEFFQRELVLSVFIRSKATDIRLMRNNKCELFYLVATQDELIILSRKNNNLEVLHRLTNVEKYEVEDSACCGPARLKVVQKDDAVPLYFDENFENLSDSTITQSYDKDDSLPLVRQLMRKLTEVKYTVQSNENTFKELVNLRQQASFSAYNTSGPLVLRSKKPIVKLCNNRIVIVLDILQCKVPIQDVVILLHGTAMTSTVYTTKLYEKISVEPFWKETITQSINQDGCNAIVGVVDLKELKYNITSRIELKGIVSYKFDNKDQILPLENVSISALDTMNSEFNILSKMPAVDNDVNKLAILCLMATTYNMELYLRHINKEESDIDLDDIQSFCTHLGMERIMDTNLIVHRNTPFHTLYGVMLLLEKNRHQSAVWNLSLYVRDPSQTLALINYIQDAVPHSIIITTTTQTISSKTCNPYEYKDVLSNINHAKVDLIDYASSMLKQTSCILNYLDSCMIKMNESKDPTVLNKVGTAIDPYAGGIETFNEFRRNILKGISNLIKNNENIQENEDSLIKSNRSMDEECMSIESD